MARQDGRIESGQPLRGAISARAWNRMMDAADAVHGNRYSVAGSSAASSLGPFTSVLAKAGVDGLDMAMGYPYSIDGLEIVPEPTGFSVIDNDLGRNGVQSFISMPVLKTTTPYRGGSTYSFCIPVEPISNGSIGRVAVDGVVPAIVHFETGNEIFCKPGNRGGGDSPMLLAGSGNCLILCRANPGRSGIEDLCLVRMNVVVPEILSGYVQQTEDWSPGTAKTVVLDDPAMVPSSPPLETNSTVSVVNNIKYYVSKPRRRVIFTKVGNGYELLQTSET